MALRGDAIEEARAYEARASLARALRRLRWETHPLIAHDVCVIEHAGDLIYITRREIDAFAPHALEKVMIELLPEFDHLPDIRLDQACFTTLAQAAVLSNSQNWSTP